MPDNKIAEWISLIAVISVVLALIFGMQPYSP